MNEPLPWPETDNAEHFSPKLLIKTWVQALVIMGYPTTVSNKVVLDDVNRLTLLTKDLPDDLAISLIQDEVNTMPKSMQKLCTEKLKFILQEAEKQKIA